MLELTLKRTYFTDATIGVLFAEDQANPVFHTIERPWLDNAVNISCIPEGTYKAIAYSSDKFKHVWKLEDVHGRTDILLHIANTVYDVKGCIAMGLSAGYMRNNGELVKSVTSSGLAFNQFRKEFDKPEEFMLTITS